MCILNSSYEYPRSRVNIIYWRVYRHNNTRTLITGAMTNVRVNALALGVIAEWGGALRASGPPPRPPGLLLDLSDTNPSSDGLTDGSSAWWPRCSLVSCSRRSSGSRSPGSCPSPVVAGIISKYSATAVKLSTRVFLKKSL